MLMDTWVVSASWLFLYTRVCKCLVKSLLSILFCQYAEVGLLDHMVILFLVFLFLVLVF